MNELKKKIQSKILIFFTIKDQQEKHGVIFQHAREIETSYSNNAIHWYDIEKKLHPTCEVYGWSCVGSANQIDNLLKDIENGSELRIKNQSYHIQKYLKHIKEEIVKGENSVETADSIFSKYKTTIFYLSESNWISTISSQCPYLLNITFCNHISGIKKSDHNYGVLNLSGFWSEGELHEYFQQHVISVDEKLAPRLTFRGSGKIDKKELEGFKGVCMHFPENLSELILNFYDINKVNIIYSKKITLKKGWAEWEVLFKNAQGEGIVEVCDGNTIIGANKFYILMDIKLDMKVMGNQSLFQDAFGRKLSTEKKQSEVEPPRSLNWNADYGLKPQLLSDDLTNIFGHMGRDLLIQDPFFIGHLAADNKITLGSQCFLNAIAIAVIQYDLQNITFLIDSKKLKLKKESKKKLVEHLKRVFQELKGFGLKKIALAYAENTFHDRYYLSISDNNTLYSVSKSVNGYLESNDLNIYKYDADDKKVLISQILHRLSRASKEDVI